MPTLAEIAGRLGVSVAGDASVAITGINTLREAASTELSFFGSNRYLDDLRTTRAAAVLVGRRTKAPARVAQPLLLVEDADLAVAQVLEWLRPAVPHPPLGVDASARVAASARLGAGSAVGPFVVIGERTLLGRNCRIHAGVVIGDDVVLGNDCELFPHVVVRERITIGHRVIIHAGSVLGTDGYGYRWDGRQHAKIPQIGTVVVEDDVEIGSCVCIDRAKFNETRVGRGTKIDNLVQIAHNAAIGEDCLITGVCAVAGSARLGRRVVMGGGSGVIDHVAVGDGAVLGAYACALQDIEPGAAVSGVPARSHARHLREQAALRRLPDLLHQVRALEEQVARLVGRKA
jgi:UDP-3-O-[3-hydroxymyristoyl] glucosamine N-acyltransferase